MFAQSVLNCYNFDKWRFALKKKLKPFVAFLLLFICVLVCGCDQTELLENPLVTKTTDFSAWEYYYQVDNLQNQLQQSAIGCIGEQSDNKSLETDIKKYVSIISNNQNILDIIRDCMATIDCFENRDKSVIFDFENLKNYKIELVSGNTYRVTYDHIFNRCIDKDFDDDVDNLVYEIPIQTTLDITLEKGENNVFNVKSVVKNCVLSPLGSAFEQTKTENGKTITIKRTIESTAVTSPKKYTQVTVNASKIVKNASGVVEKTYEHESKYFLKHNGHFYLQDTVKIEDNVSSQQTLRMDNSFSNITIIFNKQTGYLSYDLKCYLEGQLSANGEIYFQGNNKYVSKQVVSVTPTADGKPMGLNQSFVLESKLQSDNASQKLIFGKGIEIKLANQNMNTFAVHSASDGNSIVLSFKDKKANLEFFG